MSTAKPSRPHPRASKEPQRKASSAPVAEELRPGQSIELLKELHILTREGRLNQDTRRKLKQVYHLYQFIAPLLKEVAAKKPDFSLADHGAGKSYLGFILYDLYFNVEHASATQAGVKGQIYGIEARPELVEKSRALAQRLGFNGMTFLNLTVEASTTSALLPEQIDIVTALHACDTATDDAIAFGLAKNASHMALVPCCQAEVAGLLKRNKALALDKTPLAELWRHPLHTREFGSQITNVLRCLQLEAKGYDVTVTELIGWEHSMKNELILASRPALPGTASRRKTSAAQHRLQAVLQELGLNELSARFAPGNEAFSPSD